MAQVIKSIDADVPITTVGGSRIGRSRGRKDLHHLKKFTEDNNGETGLWRREVGRVEN